MRVVGVHVRLTKRLQDLIDVFGFDTDTGVLDGNYVDAKIILRQPNGNAALRRCELDRIR